MPDDLKKRGDQVRTRINVNQAFELRDWSEKFGVTPERLKQAVATIGDRADKVELFLKRSRKPAKRADG